MKHNEINIGMLRAYLDHEVLAAELPALSEHFGACAVCQAQLNSLESSAANVRAGIDYLPQPAYANNAAAWTRMRARLVQAPRPLLRWSPLRTWSLAATGAVAIFAVLVITVAPLRAWAENLLSIFRVEHVAVLDLNPDTMNVKGLEDDTVFNQQMSRIVSEEVTVTQPPQKPQPVADASTASRLAGFPVRLIAGEKPELLVFRNTITAQMKLDRDRLESILDEAGRSDLQIPRVGRWRGHRNDYPRRHHGFLWSMRRCGCSLARIKTR